MAETMAMADPSKIVRTTVNGWRIPNSQAVHRTQLICKTLSSALVRVEVDTSPTLIDTKVDVAVNGVSCLTRRNKQSRMPMNRRRWARMEAQRPCCPTQLQKTPFQWPGTGLANNTGEPAH
ncbi:hypothetical protein VFPPC_17352 [Pochonia chlamydosporia 170]|uniref:Uncharacterized protein n=1 Tax=Pochonia chlamydosporia 170 TaxID=1380566 RepID=A0A219ASC9_METCM|nr:hypothetical protein VFPPC_17352 [Pochonia chlamydosporia 170]OWT43499.1 hypothetical protein VFPPC_17352 [Pochonia chlamydosporia 170]